MTRRETAQLQHAVDALDDGDTRFAAELIVDLLEGEPRAKTYRCPTCGWVFEWPGLLATHRGLAHGWWD